MAVDVDSYMIYTVYNNNNSVLIIYQPIGTSQSLSQTLEHLEVAIYAAFWGNCSR